MTVQPAICLVACVATVAWASGQRPVFRSGTDGVSVDALVTRGNRPVAGLGPNDFMIRDNGVVQKIESASIESIPIDVTVILDTSQSVESGLGAFKRDASMVGRSLAGSDRLRLIAFATRPRLLAPFAPPSQLSALEPIRAGGGTAAIDAVVEALMYHSEADRRHLVIVFTDADDTTSVLRVGDLGPVAQRSGALLYLVLASRAPSSASRTAVAAAAAESGGRAFVPGAFKTFADAFGEIVGGFRSSYVLRYVPRGVAPEGWHDVAVTVREVPEYSVRARKGYFGG